MGKAAVDLPDPLDTPPAPSKASTDDLLAQLAGEEIDRLLAEADDPPPPPPAHRNAPPAPTPTTPLGEPSVLSASIGGPAAPPAPKLAPATTAAAAPFQDQLPGADDSPGAAAVEAASLDLGSELDALFAGANRSGASPPATAATGATDRVAASMPPTAEARPEAEGEVVGARASAEELAPTTAERAALGASLRPASRAEVDADEPDTDGVPVLLRPLAWLSAPLETCPDSVRDVVGKAAIVTALNAVAILIYVLVFRRH